ncbi:MAG: exodeoxyribonuclease III [Deltaproteobacteria bacterium]|nr:exodeoxyribonuclease III [Deltaproteobacteria bacterium]
MRIATWNINGMNARKDFVLHWLEARQPDVVALQELKMTDDRFPVSAFEDAGYHVATHGQKSWNGVALLTRDPAEVLQRGLPGQEEFGSRLITARIGDDVVTSVYCPNGKTLDHDDFGRKLEWFDALASHLDEHHPPSGASILCGDFNVCPSSLDTWRGEAADGRIFCTKEERARYEALLAHGLTDLYRDVHPTDRSFSWWDYRAGSFHKKQGLRIDFLLGTASMVERVQDAVIDRDYRKKKEGLTASDHAPVWVDLR